MFTTGYEKGTTNPEGETSKYLENKEDSEMRIKLVELNASAERLKTNLRMAISTVIKIETFSFGSFVQHVFSFLIFGIALMIDYKGKELINYSLPRNRFIVILHTILVHIITFVIILYFLQIKSWNLGVGVTILLESVLL